MAKKFLFFFGPPGSGKGTQVDMLAENLNIPVISPGELLRHEEDMETELGKRIRPLIDAGKMVPDEIVEEMVEKRLEKDDAKEGAIFDGYPRDMGQLEFILDKLRSLMSEGDMVHAIHIDVEDSIIKSRLSGRRVCDCGASYHIEFNPPKSEGKCDLCGAELYVRKDDRPEVIEERLRYYHESIKPLLDYWRKIDKLTEISGNRPIDEIHEEILGLINKL